MEGFWPPAQGGTPHILHTEDPLPDLKQIQIPQVKRERGQEEVWNKDSMEKEKPGGALRSELNSLIQNAFFNDISVFLCCCLKINMYYGISRKTALETKM